jgi:hypothetical protein
MRTEAFVIGTGRIRRRRDKSELLFRHRLPVTIGEIDPSDAPVSVIVRRTETAVYRRHNGGHWFPLAGIRPNDPVTPEGLVDLLSGAGASVWSRNPFTQHGRKTGTVPPPAEVAWRIEDDGLRDAERLSAAACRDVLFIGGVLHRRVAEPVWRVTYTARERLSALDGASLPRWHAGLALEHDGREAEFWTAARFRIDAVEKVDKLLRSLPEREEGRIVPPVEVFGFPLAAPVVEVGPPLGLPFLPGLASMPDGVLQAYSDLAARGGLDAGLLDVLFERLSRVARTGGPGSYVARCLVSDIALPVMLSRL